MGRKTSKRFSKIKEGIGKDSIFSLEDSVSKVKSSATAKFDETVEVAFNLGVDPRHADQMVRGSLVLPNGLGKEVRVLVFAKGEMENQAKDAGADHVGAEELVEKVKGGFLDFDKVVAAPDVMGLVGKIGKILGPRGLMPNPKMGTVTRDVAKVVKELKSGRVEYRVEKNGIVHCAIGKASFSEEQLKDNLLAVYDSIVKAKPATAKGNYMKKLTITSTMGVGYNIDLSSLERA